MTVTDTLVENSRRYEEGFDKGDLPLPPGKKIAVLAAWMRGSIRTGCSGSRRATRT
jgi:hypothetical protein